MAISNVRFYKLEVLPNFDVNKKGIFVHVTGTMQNKIWDKSNGDKVDPNTLLMNIKSDTLVQWLTERRIDKIASGLWFGGENGWELLSNDTTSGAIDAAIVAKINALDVEGYAQATITPDTPAEGVSNSSTLTIKGIKEVDGKIGIPVDTENRDLNIKIDGTYNETDNKIATQSTVTNAINGLNANTVQAVTFNTPENGGNTTLTFNGVKESNGVIAQGDGATTFIVGDAKLKIQIGSSTATDVFSANAQVDSTITLDGLVFRKNNNNEISVITSTAVSENNKLVTQQDIANLAGAMHYKTTIANTDAWPTTVKAGDVYIATGENFEKEGQVIESGDMIVFNSESAIDFTVVQSNITLGIQSGKIAKNDGDLTPNYMVVATSNGIKTIGISESDLTGTTDGNNTRTLSITNSGAADGDFHHAVTVSDTFKVIGKDFTKSINISSNNRSIDIAANGNTGVMVDLVWNTTMDSVSNN